MPLKHAIAQVINGRDLSFAEAEAAMDAIMGGMALATPERWQRRSVGNAGTLGDNDEPLYRSLKLLMNR